jgi:predicted GNAT superfamily acetyltransferase
VEVRRAAVADLDDVLALWAEGREEVSRLGRSSNLAEQVGPRLAEAMASGQIEALLARREGRPVGFLILRETPLTFIAERPSICIDHVFVSAQARRHGVARAMLAQVAARAELCGAEQIVSTVTPWARDTHRFFARLGFSPLSVRRSVAPSTLRRRLSGDSQRGLENLLSRRRSLRARSGRRSDLAIVNPQLNLQVPQDDVGELGDRVGELGDGTARPA